ncbi:hypothetical protein IMZ48_15915 [Candidatus Bathyarchaeota archaeon]|nr:hypothetical protein [Candidatus Bathyarchaeota archaeon]
MPTGRARFSADPAPNDSCTKNYLYTHGAPKAESIGNGFSPLGRTVPPAIATASKAHLGDREQRVD